jgi:hypothetical protein
MNQTSVKAIVRQNLPGVVKQSHTSTPEVETLIKAKPGVGGKSPRSFFIFPSTTIYEKKKKKVRKRNILSNKKKKKKRLNPPLLSAEFSKKQQFVHFRDILLVSTAPPAVAALLYINK